MVTVTPVILPLRNPSSVRVLAIIQIFLGALLILLEVTGLGMRLGRLDIVTVTGAGIWSGIFFTTTGLIGVFSARRPVENVDRRCLFIAYLVLSIIGCLLAIGLAISSGVALAVGGLIATNCDVTDMVLNGACNAYHTSKSAFEALRVLALIFYLVLFVLCIVTAAFGCCNTCRPGSQMVITRTTTHQVVHQPYAPQPYPACPPPHGNQAPVYFMSGSQAMPPYPGTTSPMAGMTYEQPPVYVPPSSEAHFASASVVPVTEKNGIPE